MVKNPPANAGDTGSIPGPGSTHMPQGNQTLYHSYLAHVVQLLSLHASINKACVPKTPAPQQDKALQRKAHAGTKE